MSTGMIHDQNLEKQIEKQMGCMTGFLHLFDRNQVLNGKRIYTNRRLSPYSPMDYSCSQSECSLGSPAFSGELQANQKKETVQKPTPPVRSSASPSPSPAPEYTEAPTKKSLPLPVFECKEGSRSSWKFKEAPRLSLDSRATVDAKGSFYPKEIRTNVVASKEDDSDKQRRSPSVIARLMGLDALPDSGREPIKKVELRRSASESRVSRDLRFIDNGNNFQVKNGNQFNNVKKENNAAAAREDFMNQPQNGKPWKSQQGHVQPKSYFDSQDFFPEPKQTGSLAGEIEKRLKLRGIGIDEPAKDLETLKHILEALQLKGLLHAKRQEQSRNFVFDKRFSCEEAPIVVMKPTRLQVSVNRIGRNNGAESVSNVRPKQRNLNFSGESLSSPVRHDQRSGINRDVRNSKFSKQNQSSEKSPSSLARRRAESKSPSCQRKGNDSVEPRRNSPKINIKNQSSSGSPRSKSMADIESDRPKIEDYNEGRSLLERCDKLLNSIAEITGRNTELQPSPVSVLDSSFYKDESSPSPVKKRCIDFTDESVELDDDNWSPAISPIRLKSNDSDFLYVSEILRASTCLSEDTDVFWLLEKEQYRTNSSDSSRLHRKLVFDITTEILDRKTQLPPWKTFSSAKCTPKASNLHQIWSEFQRIRERDQAEELFEIIGCVLRKDIEGDSITGWGETPMETSEAVLDIERLIFKDLVVETIQDLATFSGRYRAPFLRRKLLF
ncbi:hypothetical protein ACHQM5_014646 [Ranunculus cassubicifolius]